MRHMGFITALALIGVVPLTTTQTYAQESEPSGDIEFLDVPDVEGELLPPGEDEPEVRRRVVHTMEEFAVTGPGDSDPEPDEVADADDDPVALSQAQQDELAAIVADEAGEDEAPFATAQLPDWLELGFEYRVRTEYINSLDLSGTVPHASFTTQRGRLHLGLSHDGWLTVRTRIDFFDGVLFGDNGLFRTDPSSNTGVGVATREPNNTGVEVGLPEGADPLDTDSYVPVLTAVEPVEVDHLYADIVLPIGLLRIGRQPNLGQGIGAHDGERGNRWGVAKFRDGGDRILFATKLDEAIRLLAGGEGELNTSLEEGVFIAGWYEFFNQGDLPVAGDNLRQAGGTVFWREPELMVGGGTWRDLNLQAAFANVQGDDFDTRIYAFPLSAAATIGPVTTSLSASFIRGQTREISEGFAALAGSTPEIQRLAGTSARAMIDIEAGPAIFTIEVDYGSSDNDPRAGSDITSAGFARDTNVGLLLFEKILEYETARSAAVGIENLRNVQSDSFPITEARSDGRFSSAFALFPQAYVQLVDAPEHSLHTRLGVLAAWAPKGVVDPILTSLAEDGNEISDDAVNYHGGDPGSYYGTEFDLQLGWIYREHFHWTLEGAALLPGDSLQDENGDAVPAFFIENRLEAIF